MRLRRVGARALDRRITNGARILVRIASAASRLATCADAGVLSVRLSSEWSALPRYACVPNGTSRPSHWQIPSRDCQLEIADDACVETTQPAVEVAELRPEKDTANETQQRIAQPTMERAGMAPLSMPPLNLFPITRSYPSRSFATKPSSREKS
jgi:hypothetical protein